MQAHFDLHGYFTCWRQVGLMVEKLAELMPGPAVRAVWEAHKATLRRYQEARDHLEHFNERIEGQRLRKQLPTPLILGMVSGDTYVFAGQEYDISLSSLELLRRIVREVEDALRVHSTGVASPDPP